MEVNLRIMIGVGLFLGIICLGKEFPKIIWKTYEDLDASGKYSPTIAKNNRAIIKAKIKEECERSGGKLLGQWNDIGGRPNHGLLICKDRNDATTAKLEIFVESFFSDQVTNSSMLSDVTGKGVKLRMEEKCEKKSGHLITTPIRLDFKVGNQSHGALVSICRSR